MRNIRELYKVAIITNECGDILVRSLEKSYEPPLVLQDYLSVTKDNVPVKSGWLQGKLFSPRRLPAVRDKNRHLGNPSSVVRYLRDDLGIDNRLLTYVKTNQAIQIGNIEYIVLRYTVSSTELAKIKVTDVLIWFNKWNIITPMTDKLIHPLLQLELVD